MIVHYDVSHYYQGGFSSGGFLYNMVDDEKKGKLAADSFNEPENFQRFPNSIPTQRLEKENNFMETEGRVYPDFYRNSSEELFLKTIMESSIGMPVPTMEMLGFKNLSHTFRTDSEELFKSWLTTAENHGNNSTATPNWTRQPPRRISTELARISTEIASSSQSGGSNMLLPQNTSVVDDFATELNQQSMRTAVERGLQASNLYLAKAWFHSSQPMTRSRSSELRKRYAAMQNSQMSLGVEVVHNASGKGSSKLKQEFPNPNSFNDPSICEIPNELNTFLSPSNSSSSTFNTPQLNNVDNVTSVVSMLKGTLERKRLNNNNHIENESIDGSSFQYYNNQEVPVSTCLEQEQKNQYQEANVGQNVGGDLEIVGGQMDMDFEGFVNPINPIQLGTILQEPSQSESSAAAPVVSTGFDVCDGPSNSGQTTSMCESSKKEVGNGKNSGNGPRAKGIRERIIESHLKDDRKKGSLVRLGSVTSADSVDKGDPTKKRRVERSRKMAEAKERNSTPVIPSDMQSIVKRCENLEKEVRSLKLNLSFMNRKDSEQTTLIEELQKENKELSEEKDRLLEEIERILIETGKI